MRKVKFIINPVSGVGKQKKIGELIKKGIDKNAFQYEIVYTKAAGHAKELSRQSAQQGFDIVVAVGGDGSVNEVGAGLIGTNTAMAIIPAGSGNGLARHVGISTIMEKAVQVINTGKIISIDTITVNEKPYLGIAGIGFDAHIAHEFATYGTRGFFSYVKLVFREWPGYKSREYELEIDGNLLKKEAFLICIANASQFGNNAVIAPCANIQDGLMDVCILQKAPYTKLIPLIYRLFNKTVNKSVFLETIRCKSLTIKNNKGGFIHLDGEPKRMGEELHFVMNPLSLKMLVPA